MKAKRILLIIILGIMPVAHCMRQESTEPETKKPRTTVPQPPALPLALELQAEQVAQIMSDYAKWLETQDTSPVILQSSDGFTFVIPFHVARQSRTLDDLIEDTRIDDPIPLPTIDGQTLAIVVKLMEIVDRFRMMHEQNAFLYIPRALQPVLNQILAQASPELLVKLLTAANYLNLPFILNGVAAVIADRIPSRELQNQVALLWTVNIQDEAHADKIQKAETTLREHKIPATIATIAKPARPWILKHLAHRKYGIRQEYSIADYIKEHGQPILEMSESTYGADDQNTLALEDKGLTSLYGITLLQQQAATRDLNITDNCFYDFSLDPQPAQNSFAGYTKLLALSLRNNKIIRISPDFFKGLKVNELDLGVNHIEGLSADTLTGIQGLKYLDLFMNELTRLQKGVFDNLSELEVLDLNHNKLTTIPIGMFTGLIMLQRLYLTGNLLSQEEQARIRAELPETVEIEYEY